MGAQGTILSYDGAKWSKMTSGVSADLLAVSGSASNNVYAVGAAGTTVYYDGNTWAKLASGKALDLEAVWVGPKDAYAMDDKATILHRCSP